MSDRGLVNSSDNFAVFDLYVKPEQMATRLTLDNLDELGNFFQKFYTRNNRYYSVLVEPCLSSVPPSLRITTWKNLLDLPMVLEIPTGTYIIPNAGTWGQEFLFYPPEVFAKRFPLSHPLGAVA